MIRPVVLCLLLASCANEPKHTTHAPVDSVDKKPWIPIKQVIHDTIYIHDTLRIDKVRDVYIGPRQ